MNDIFISYAREDQSVAERLYLDLQSRGFKVWLDSKNLLPGSSWRLEIAQAIRDSRSVLVLLSNSSSSKRGFIQSEIREALDALNEFPDGEIFLIPARLEDCQSAHRKLKDLQWVDLFPCYNAGLDKIMTVLDRICFKKVVLDLGRAKEADAGDSSQEYLNASEFARLMQARSYKNSNPRLHRIERDAQSVMNLAKSWDLIDRVEMDGLPPEVYRVQFSTLGISSVDVNGKPKYRSDHVLELRLHEDYPVSLPFASFTTPVFHPNMWENGKICMGWHRIPYCLSDVIIHAARMIDFQIFSTQSPYPSNQLAAIWAEKNPELFPLVGWDGPGGLESSVQRPEQKIRVERKHEELEI